MLAPGGPACVFAAFVEVDRAEGAAELGSSVVQVVLVADVDVAPVRDLHVALRPRALHEVRVERELHSLLHRTQRRDVCRAGLLLLAVPAQNRLERALLDRVWRRRHLQQHHTHLLVFEQVDFLGVEVVERPEVQADARDLELDVGGDWLLEGDLVDFEARGAFSAFELNLDGLAGLLEAELLAERILDDTADQSSFCRQQQRERLERRRRHVHSADGDGLLRHLSGQVQLARVLLYDQVFRSFKSRLVCTRESHDAQQS